MMCLLYLQTKVKMGISFWG